MKKAEVEAKGEELEISTALVYEHSDNVLPGIGKMLDRVMAQKRINANRDDVYDILQSMYDIIRYFNSIDEYTTLLFGGIDIKEVKVLKEFSDFIVPSAIRFDPTDLRSKNLAVKESVLSVPCSYLEYVNLCDKFRALFKKDASSDLVSLVDKKRGVTLSSVIDQVSNQMDGVYQVNYGTTVYYPIRLQDISVLYEPRHFNANESDLVSDYLSNFRF